MPEDLRHFDEASLFRPWAVAMAIVSGINLMLTVVHARQELRGRLWRHFGAIAGVCIRIPSTSVSSSLA